MMRVAVVGAGWAGVTAALTLARGGISVTVFEANAIPGGRARVVDKGGRLFDNGQHLLLGAYARTLTLISSLHGSTERAYQRLPLTLRSAPGTPAGLALTAPTLPAPLHLLFAILAAKGLSPKEKFSASVWAARHLSKAGFGENVTVAELIKTQPQRLRQLLWEPLCIAALNTPPEAATASVFVEVLRRTFTGDARASDLIIPRINLTSLMPAPALAEVVSRGGEVKLATYVTSVQSCGTGAAVILRDESRHEFDYVVVATGPHHVPRLLGELPYAAKIVESLRRLVYEPITTLFFDFNSAGSAANEKKLPMLMLDGIPGQWLFWHVLSNGHLRASVVISAHHRLTDEPELLRAALSQLKQRYELPAPVWQFAITEKRATYACSPEQTRALTQIPDRLGRIFFAGDWCEPQLPATLEAAVISGERAAQQILANHDHD